MADLAVYCDAGHEPLDVEADIQTEFGRRQYRCGHCRLSLVAKDDRWAAVSEPVAALGIDRIALQVLVLANERAVPSR